MRSIDHIELTISWSLKYTIESAYVKSWPVKAKTRNRGGLQRWAKLDGETMKLFNRSNTWGNWAAYKQCLPESTRIRNTENNSRSDCCQGNKNIPERARLYKMLSKSYSNSMGLMEMPDDIMTENWKQTRLLLKYRYFFKDWTLVSSKESAVIQISFELPCSWLCIFLRLDRSLKIDYKTSA